MALRQPVLLLGLLTFLMADFGVSSILKVNNGGRWGLWDEVKGCPLGSYAYGFSLKVEGKQGGGDDTALNGIQLFCKDASTSQHTATLLSAERWGDWTSARYCSSGRLVSFQLRVERPQGDGDDTAANNVRFRCTDGSVMEGYGLNWGDWGSWSGTCGAGICSMMAKLESAQGGGDDTALNDVQMFCCPF